MRAVALQAVKVKVGESTRLFSMCDFTLSMAVLVGASIAGIKLHKQKQLGEERVYFIL